MKREEFEDRMIDACNSILKMLRYDMPRGICYTLDLHVGLRVSEVFHDFFTPNSHAFPTFWYGERNEENAKDRAIALLFFEQHCLEYKLYEEF